VGVVWIHEYKPVCAGLDLHVIEHRAVEKLFLGFGENDINAAAVYQHILDSDIVKTHLVLDGTIGLECSGDTQRELLGVTARGRASNLTGCGFGHFEHANARISETSRFGGAGWSDTKGVRSIP